MPSLRRIGSETSKTRGVLLDAAEQVMLDDGYAAVTYRSLAERAGVTPGLVQYYFPTLDDMFLILLRRLADKNYERLLTELEARADEPLRIMWEFSTDEVTAALLMELMALANHRKIIRAAIFETTERIREAELMVLSARWDHYREGSGGLSPEALLFLLHAIPKSIQLEEAVGLFAGHDEVLRFVQARLDRVEPRAERARKLSEVAPKKKAGPRRQKAAGRGKAGQARGDR